MDNIEISKETLASEVRRLDREAIAKKHEYLVNLRHFRRAIDNSRHLEILLNVRENTMTEEDILLVKEAIRIENENVETLRTQSFVLYAVYDALSILHGERNKLLKEQVYG